jgi:hypothetical protein
VASAPAQVAARDVLAAVVALAAFGSWAVALALLAP